MGNIFAICRCWTYGCRTCGYGDGRCCSYTFCGNFNSSSYWWCRDIFCRGNYIYYKWNIKSSRSNCSTEPEHKTERRTIYTTKYRKKAQNSNKNERHGDSGRAKLKAEKQIKDLEQKARESKSKRERTQIENKIRNIRNNAAKKQRGEEHSKGNKR